MRLSTIMKMEALLLLLIKINTRSETRADYLLLIPSSYLRDLITQRIVWILQMVLGWLLLKKLPIPIIYLLLTIPKMAFMILILKRNSWANRVGKTYKSSKNLN